MKSDSSEPDTLVKAPRATSSDVDDPTSTLDGYAFGEVIGRGGIGEVVLAHDLRVGRDVAIKRLRSAHPTEAEMGRFLREARIQARLDHPAIPPVHELGRDEQNRPYFTMKRLAGETLAELLRSPEPNRQRLLRAFADVCLAIDFAHERGVVHRDLKPANLMLGRYGDVYVLDWGIARIVGEAGVGFVADDIDTLDHEPSTLIGSPGYMAPEQLDNAAEAGPAADIYSLGAILFEVLAGEPLHPRGQPAIESTAAGTAVTSPAKRAVPRAIPPELDALCIAMLAMEPGSRPSARRVAERVEAYLDGDRDQERRRTMAVDLVWAARNAFNDGRRAEAMSASGRALALDPESTEAAALVTGLMLEPPTELPDDLRAMIARHEHDGVKRHARYAAAAYIGFGMFTLLAAWTGIKRWDLILLLLVTALALAAGAWRIVRRPDRPLAHMIVYACGNALLVGTMSRIAGPFTFVPALACVVISSMMAYPKFLERPWLLMVIVGTGFLLPIVLELAGAIPPTWEIGHDTLITYARAIDFEGPRAVTLLIGVSFATIYFAAMLAARVYRIGADAQRKLVIQAWRLRQLLPGKHIED